MSWRASHKYFRATRLNTCFFSVGDSIPRFSRLCASPASVLALHVGQVMLVVRADQTSESDLRAAVNTLDACEHIQLVLNAVALQPGGRRFGSYYGYGEAGK